MHSAAAKAGVKNLTESLAVEWGPYGIQVNGLVPGLFPHEDMTADIRGNLDRTDDKDVVPARAARRPAPGARLGGDVPRVAVRALHLRAHARRRRRELAAPKLTNPPVVTVREQMGKRTLLAQRRLRLSSFCVVHFAVNCLG